MSKIRADLIGVVMAGGRTFAAGQDVPEGIEVHESLLEDAPAPQEDPKPAGETPGTKSTPEDPKEDEKDAETEDSEDFSDILSGDEEKPAPAKAPARGGRKPAASKKG